LKVVLKIIPGAIPPDQQLASHHLFGAHSAPPAISPISLLRETLPART